MTLLSNRPKPKSPNSSQDTSLQAVIASRENVGRQKHKALALAGVALLALGGGLGVKLVHLQVVDGNRWRKRADENRIRLIARQPERGRVLDAQGRELIGSKLAHSVFLWPAAKSDPKSWDMTLEALAKIINRPKAELAKRLAQHEPSSIDRIRVARNVTPAQITQIAEAGPVLYGVEVDAETTRVYPFGKTGAHILGYTGELNEAEYQKLKAKGYKRGDVNGKLGIEAALEERLRGTRGGKTVEVDATGQVVQVLGDQESRMGEQIQLTIDIKLQAEVEKALGERKGAIVVLDPNNGEVLAMASWPTFDPNMFSKPIITEQEWGNLQKLPHPFVNRAVQAFMPASTFKIVTTAAAIESGKWSADTVLQTYPSLTVGGTTFGEWNKAGFGPLDFAGAIMHSSDTFFYQIAKRIDGKPFETWMRKFGVGEKTGIELMNEAAGILPDEAWKRRTLQEGWVLGDSINMSIGQGFVTMSPLQVAAAYAVPANGGDRVRPHIIKDKDFRKYRQSLNLNPETLRLMREGLRGVVTQTTGQDLNVGYLPPVAGKSGTSEDLGDGSDTWFAAYAPYEKPEIVVVAFAERSGGSGGEVGGPMVRDVMAAYFRLKQEAQAQR